jgi:hypothetical protein
VKSVTRLGLFPVAALVAALTVAGCSSTNSSTNRSTSSTTSPPNGIPSESASQILNSVEQAVSSATSVQVNGTTEQGGKPVTFQVVTFATGDFSGGLDQGGNSVKLVKVGSTDYLNAGPAYFRAVGVSAPVAGLLGGIWVSGPDSQLGFGSSFTIASVEANIRTPKGTITKGSASTVDGQSAFSVVSSKGGVLWVATIGKAYPIELDNSGTNGGTVTFSKWNQGTPPVAPPGAKPISSFG